MTIRTARDTRPPAQTFDAWCVSADPLAVEAVVDAARTTAEMTTGVLDAPYDPATELVECSVCYGLCDPSNGSDADYWGNRAGDPDIVVCDRYDCRLAAENDGYYLGGF